jgi:ankyrin repeat protein
MSFAPSSHFSAGDEREFLEAAARGDLTALRTALRGDPALSRARGEHDATALHWAAEGDRLEMAQLLVAAGADVEAATSWGATAFDWAATMGSARVAALLLDLGATGLTVITAASLGRFAAVVGFLEDGCALSVATHRRRDAPLYPDDDWPADSAHLRGDVLSDALYGTCRNGFAAVASYLLDRGADVNAKGIFGGTGLHWAAVGGKRATVELLLRRGANRRLRDGRFAATAADWAREGGHDEIACLLGV